MTANAPAPTQSPDSESQTDAPPPAAAAKPVDPTDSPDAYQAALEAEVARRIDAVERRWQSRKDRELNRARRRWESEAGQVIDPELLAWIADADPREVGQWLKTGPDRSAAHAARASRRADVSAGGTSRVRRIPAITTSGGWIAVHTFGLCKHSGLDPGRATDGRADRRRNCGARVACTGCRTRGRSPRTPGRTAQPGPLARPLS